MGFADRFRDRARDAIGRVAGDVLPAGWGTARSAEERRAIPVAGGVRTFVYEAVSVSGARHKGRMQAPNRQTVTQALQADGWVPLKIDEISNTGLNRDISSAIGSDTASANVTPQQVANFSRQLAQLLNAGVATSRALAAIGEEQGGRMQLICASLSERASAGIPLSEGLAQYPEVFDDVFCAYVKAGETSGSLGPTMSRLARAMEKKVALALKIKSVTAYPKIVSTIIGFIVVGIITFIVPKFAGIYKTFNAPLPTPTRILSSATGYVLPIAFSKTFKGAQPYTFFTAPDANVSVLGLLLRIVAVIAVWMWLQARRNKKGKKTTAITVVMRVLVFTPMFLFTYKWHIVWPSLFAWGSIALIIFAARSWISANIEDPRVARAVDLMRYKVPVFGELSRLTILYRWTSTLAGVASSGVPMGPALELASRTAGSSWHTAILKDLQAAVRSGKPLSEAVAVYPELFPASVRSMIATGEQTGDVPAMLDSAATSVDAEIDALTAGLAAKIEVLLLVVMGVVVGGLLIVLYLPILRLAVTASDGLYKQNMPNVKP